MLRKKSIHQRTPADHFLKVDHLGERNPQRVPFAQPKTYAKKLYLNYQVIIMVSTNNPTLTGAHCLASQGWTAWEQVPGDHPMKQGLTNQ